MAGGSEVKQLIIAHAQSLCISDGFAEYSHYNFREFFYTLCILLYLC